MRFFNKLRQLFSARGILARHPEAWSALDSCAGSSRLVCGEPPGGPHRTARLFEPHASSAVNPTLKKRLIMALKVAVSVGILTFLFYNVGEEGQWQALRDAQKRWSWVLAGLAACLAANLISFFRWQMMVRALDLPFSFLDAVRIGFIGLFFGLFAFGVIGGDTLRAYYVTRQVRDRRPAAITSVLADRLIGILTMFSIASTAFLFFDPGQLQGQPADQLEIFDYVGWAVVTCTAIGWAAVTVIYLTPRLTGTELYYRLSEVPRLGDLLGKVTRIVTLYRHRQGTVLAAFGFSLAVNLCFATSIYCLAHGLLETNPSPLDHLIIEPIAMVCNALPLPGGIGGMEFAMKYLYLAFGSRNGVIVGFAFRFALLLVSGIGAVVWFLNRAQVADLETAEEPLTA